MSTRNFGWVWTESFVLTPGLAVPGNVDQGRRVTGILESPDHCFHTDHVGYHHS
jgi:hypothetical protein